MQAELYLVMGYVAALITTNVSAALTRDPTMLVQEQKLFFILIKDECSISRRFKYPSYLTAYRSGLVLKEALHTFPPILLVRTWSHGHM